jgi:hypothetical protein
MIKNHFLAQEHKWLMLDCQKFERYLVAIEYGLGDKERHPGSEEGGLR